MPDFQFYFELIGAVAFAVSGAALAVKKGMDLFGVAVMGMTTAVGGGILRDMLLGLTPPAALKDPLQALVAIATYRRQTERYGELVLANDRIAAMTQALYRSGLSDYLDVIDAERSLYQSQGYGANVFLVLLVGVLTGVGGGVLRDVCCMERPYIFTKHVYACASLAGAAVCMALWSMGESFAMLMGCGVTLALRICAAVFRWSLPKA